jgi:hypothetical protein
VDHSTRRSSRSAAAPVGPAVGLRKVLPGGFDLAAHQPEPVSHALRAGADESTA